MLSNQSYHTENGGGNGGDPDSSTSTNTSRTTTTTTNPMTSTSSSIMTLNNNTSTTNGTTAFHMSPPNNKDYAQRMQQIDDLKYFLATANDGWACPTSLQSPPYQVHTFPLPTGEHISCVLWNNLYHITGTDIVRSLVFRFHAFGRPVHNLKKFEEGVFSDLRNLKPGLDACLEEPRSEFLDMLYKNNCIRTKKKQKVFYWFSVPHDRLFLDALERDLKREKIGTDLTSQAVAEPAISLSLDSTQELFDHLRKSLSLAPTPTGLPTTSTSIVPPTGTSTSPSSSSSSLPGMNAATAATKMDNEDENYDHNDNDYMDNVTSMQLPLEDAPPSKNKVWIGQHQLGNDEAPQESRVYVDPTNLGQSPIVMHQHQDQSRSSPIVQHSTDYHSFLSPNDSTNFQNQHRRNNSAASCPSIHMQHLDKNEKRVLQQHVFRPSRSLDLQMTKKIFGKLPLFDGSPTYKQRRHRAASVTTSHHQYSGTATSPLSLSPALTTLTAATAAASVNSENGKNDSIKQHKRPSSMIMSSQLAKAAIAAGHHHHHDSKNKKNDEMTAEYLSGPDDDMTDDDDQMDNANNKTLISASSYNALAKATSALASVMSDDPRARCTFTCPLHACGKLFRRLEHLKRHLRTHTLHRPHLCQTCGKRFSRSDNLAQHKKVHQKAATPITVANSCIGDEKLGFQSPLVYDPFYPPIYNDENYDAFPLDDLQQHVMDNTATTTSVTDPLMDFSIHDENVSLNSSLCNSPTMGHSFGRQQYYHQYPQQYDIVNSAASSIVPSPSSSSSSPYRGGIGSDGSTNLNNSANDYHYQLQQQQMQALQQALTSCMKKSTIHSPSSPFLSTPSTTATYSHYQQQQQQQQQQRPVQVSHRWSLPEAPTFSSSTSSTSSSSNVNASAPTTTTGSSLLTSPFVPPFQMNDLHGDDHWSQWHHLTHSATAMDLNDLHSFASTS
ncbi:unnamed protein product [Absidia cylindrospora]